ncbi:MAG: hypothetical protein ACOC4I_06145 [Spirochaetota bacterium]
MTNSTQRIRAIVLLFCAVTLSARVASAQVSREDVDSVSAGIILGEPTGISVKLWLGDISAVDIALAWSFTDEGAFYVNADYLTHFFEMFDVAPDRLPLYAGVGGHFRVRSGGQGSEDSEPGAGAAVRVPLGVSFLPTDVPLDLFFEVAPALTVFPETGFSLEGGIGVRYRF